LDRGYRLGRTGGNGKHCQNTLYKMLKEPIFLVEKKKKTTTTTTINNLIKK
jgi:hypothetical protein